MARSDELLSRILRGTSDANIAFNQRTQITKAIGFYGTYPRGPPYFQQVEEIINLQPKGSKAKPYQVKQVRGVIVKYRLSGEKNEK